MQLLLTDLSRLWRVTMVALVLGAGLPALFALGVRLQSVSRYGRGGTAGNPQPVTDTARRSAGAGALLCYGVVLAVIITGVLFVAKAFLASRFDIHLFGQR